MENLDFTDLLNKLNIECKNPNLYKAAFTHVSYKNEHKNEDCEDYDRLEFIGDGVLDLVVADLIYHHFPNMRSGELSKCRSSLVMGTTLSSFSSKLGFEKYVRVSKGEQKLGSINKKILEDVFEAFIGAYYLDNEKDFNKVKDFVINLFKKPLQHYQQLEEFDYKSRLQEIIQAGGKGNINYVVVSETGSPQDKNFVIEVRVDGISLGKGNGSSKKKAEQMAAKNALERMV